jgi:hypothetical protein
MSEETVSVIMTNGTYPWSFVTHISFVRVKQVKAMYSRILQVRYNYVKTKNINNQLLRVITVQ